MKAPSSLSDRRTSFELQMTPMIDVVFLLLVFFVWTASFQVAERILPSDVSAASQGAGKADPNQPPPPEADFDNVVVRITFAGGRAGWRVNDQPVASVAELQQQLANIAAIKRDVPVILHPDGTVPLGNVIEAYDVAKAVRLEKIQFAANGTKTE